MRQHLYLLRHAQAETWSALGNDFSRALSLGGSRHAQSAANWAQETLLVPDTAVCSPAKRTRETLAPFLSNWPQLLSTTDYVESMYCASLNMLLTLLADAFSYSERLLMVGHNPGLGSLLTRLVQPNNTAAISGMAPGTLAVIEFPRGFSSTTHDGEIQYLKQKSDLDQP